MAHRTLIVIVVWFALGCVSPAQTPNPEPTSKGPPVPIVSFDFVLPGSMPPHYAISVEPDGKASYRADDAPTANSAPMQPDLQQFLVSEPTRKRISELALALNCFQGNFEYRGHSVANMGAKTLKCTYADHGTHTTYNYTTNPQLQELTTIFQNISNTMEFGRRLEYLHRFDKLGLEGALKSMEEQEKEKRLGELQAVAPELEQILNDNSVMNVSRHRAGRLLQAIKANPAARAAVPQ
jgi:hypothetical protein